MHTDTHACTHISMHTSIQTYIEKHTEAHRHTNSSLYSSFNFILYIAHLVVDDNIVLGSHIVSNIMINN